MNGNDPPQKIRTKRLRILVVDDDRPVAEAIAAELDDCDVVVAESGQEVLALIGRDAAFDVVLCDVMMPDMTGMEVHEGIRVVEPALASRIVFMTGGAFTTQAREFLSTVGNTSIEKPFSADALRAMLGRLVGD